MDHGIREYLSFYELRRRKVGDAGRIPTRRKSHGLVGLPLSEMGAK